MLILKIKKLHPKAVLPSYAHPGDAGLDLFAAQDAEVLVGARTAISTGIAMEIPKGYVGLIWDKSGLAVKSGLKTMAGVVDEGYRGEVLVCLSNLSKKTYFFKKGEKVAQMIIQKKESVKIKEVKEINDTKRGKGGFGSTGK